MAENANAVESVRGVKRRKKMGSRNKKRPRMMGGSGNKVKVDRKMKKLFQKRAREYNSDDDDDKEAEAPAVEDDNKVSVQSHEEEVGDEEFSEGEEKEGKDLNADAELSEDDENGEIQPGITKFTEGCRAFRAAFRSILKKSISEETLVVYILHVLELFSMWK